MTQLLLDCNLVTDAKPSAKALITPIMFEVHPSRVTTPTFSLAGFIAESRAIARYLAEMYQDQGVPLLGKSLEKRAIINQWIEVESQNFRPAIGPMVRELFVSGVMNKPLNEAIVHAGLAKLKPVFEVYEAQLSKHKYIAGDEYSLADLFHAPNLHYLMTTLKTEVYGNHPRVLAWAENITSRPAFAKVVELDAKWLKQRTQ